MSIFRTLLQFLAPCFLLGITASAVQAQNSIAAIEAEYDGVDSRLFAMRDFIQKARREGATITALAHALDVMEELDAKLVILRQRLQALTAEDANQDEDVEGELDLGADSDGEGFGVDDTQDLIPDTDGVDIIDLTGNTDGVTDVSADDGDDLWDELVADADANPSEYEYGTDAADVEGAVDNGDGWDDIDEVDDTLYDADQGRINAMRDQMAGQIAGDKSRISSNTRRQYLNIQAERRRAREEYLRQQAQRQAELAATLQSFANLMNPGSQPTASPPVRSSTPTSRSSGGSSGGGMTNAQYQAKLKRCMDAKYAKARNSGFPIMDPNGPRIQCDAQIRNGRAANSSSSGSSNGPGAWQEIILWMVQMGHNEIVRGYGELRYCNSLWSVNCVVLVGNCQGKGPVFVPPKSFDYIAEKRAAGKTWLVRLKGEREVICRLNGK